MPPDGVDLDGLEPVRVLYAGASTVEAAGSIRTAATDAEFDDAAQELGVTVVERPSFPDEVGVFLVVGSHLDGCPLSARVLGAVGYAEYVLPSVIVVEVSTIPPGVGGCTRAGSVSATLVVAAPARPEYDLAVVLDMSTAVPDDVPVRTDTCDESHWLSVYDCLFLTSYPSGVDYRWYDKNAQRYPGR